jgi:hypothetical protein
MWGGVTNPGLRRTTSSFTRNQGMRGNGAGGKEAQPQISPNSKTRGLGFRGLGVDFVRPPTWSHPVTWERVSFGP